MPSEVKGVALHGATHDGGEASQLKLTSFEVLHAVRGGHALTGARPDDGGHQGSSHPHHPDGGHIPANYAVMVKRRAEKQAARRNYYVKSAVGKQYKTNRNEELPRHRALIMTSHLEDSKGGDLVEYPVVFPSSNPARYGRSTR